MPSTSPDKNERRALTLLRLVDDDARAVILDSLPADLRTELRNRIRVTNATRLPASKSLERLLEEFEAIYDCVQSLRGPKLKLHQPLDIEEEESIPYELTGKTVVDLERMNSNQLAAALGEENPRNVALILSRLSPIRVAELMQSLRPELRRLVAKELARNPQAPDFVFEKIASCTVERATQLPTRRNEQPDPVLHIAEAFREIEKPDRRDLIESIREENPDIAAELQKAMYRFEDLIDLDDRSVQAILAQIDSATLQDALFEADEEIIEKIMSNLSRRAAATLREELAYQRAVSPAQSKLAREAVASVIGEIDEEAA